MLRRGFFPNICLSLKSQHNTAQGTPHLSMTPLFTNLFYHSLILHRKVSGIQQLNEWTDILTHELRSSSLSDKNSFESKTHKRDILKTNSIMAKVYGLYTVEFCYGCFYMLEYQSLG